MADKTEIEAALAAQSAGRVIDAGVRHVIVPPGWSVEDLRLTLPTPDRIKGKTAVRDVPSFALLVNEFKAPSTKLFGTIDPPRFVAVFNDNAQASGPGWGDHRVEYACPTTKEWQIWTKSNKVGMPQVDFAQFIEDNLPDLLDGATMLEVSRSLEAKKSVNFASGIRLDNGAQEFTFEETIQGTAQKGKFRVPEMFEIGIPVFEGGPLYKIRARFRYRISDSGKLTLWYDLERPHKVIEDAVKQVWEDIAAKTELTILHAAVA